MNRMWRILLNIPDSDRDSDRNSETFSVKWLFKNDLCCECHECEQKPNGRISALKMNKRWEKCDHNRKWSMELDWLSMINNLQRIYGLWVNVSPLTTSNRLHHLANSCTLEEKKQAKTVHIWMEKNVYRWYGKHSMA